MLSKKYIVHGVDFKARLWMRAFGDRAAFFESAGQLIRVCLEPGDKSVIFRYQNSQRYFAADFAYTAILVLLLATRWLWSVRVFWILHNIDVETRDKYPLLTKIRRKMLTKTASRIFVTDQMFKETLFPGNAKYRHISFGRKTGGSISPDNLSAIARFSEDYDLVALCLGASGDKYLHFERLSELTNTAETYGKSLGLIVSSNSDYKGDNALAINEKNIDETAISQFVDFVYRINDDISMPFTLYAASEARIPVVSAPGFYTLSILERYGIGLSENAFFQASDEQLDEVRKNMGAFLEGRTWDSLYDEIMDYENSIK